MHVVCLGNTARLLYVRNAVRFFVRLPKFTAGILTYFKVNLGDMTDNLQVDVPQSSQAVFVRCCLKWWKLKEDERTICAECKDGFVQPECEYEEFTAPEPEILNNFADHILDGTPLLAAGEEGLKSLSISNAAYVSAWTDDWAEIPASEDIFEEQPPRLCRDEKKTKKPPVVSEPAEKLSERWRARR